MGDGNIPIKRLTPFAYICQKGYFGGLVLGGGGGIVGLYMEEILCLKILGASRNHCIKTASLNIKPGSNEDESCRKFKLSLSFGLKLSCALGDSRRISSTLVRSGTSSIFLESC